MLKVIFICLLSFSLTSCISNTFIGALIGMGVGGAGGAVGGYFVGDNCEGCNSTSSLSDAEYGAITGGVGGALLLGITGAVIGHYIDDVNYQEKNSEAKAKVEKQKISNELQALFLSACRTAKVDLMEKMIKSDERYLQIFDPNLKNCLHLTSELGHMNATKLLVHHGVYLNTQDRYGRTALHHAVIWKRVAIAIYLIGEGAALDIKDERGRRPIDYYDKNSEKSKKLFSLMSQDKEAQ